MLYPDIREELKNSDEGVMINDEQPESIDVTPSSQNMELVSTDIMVGKKIP